MSQRDKILVTLMHGVLLAITVAVLLVTFFVTLPMAETRWFPVVETLQVDKVEPASEGRSIIYGSFDKIRQCDYGGIAWFERKANGDLERVSVELLRRPGDTSSPNRPLGQQTAGPWVIGIPADRVIGASVVELTHRCHPFWTTVTHFFP